MAQKAFIEVRRMIPEEHRAAVVTVLSRVEPLHSNARVDLEGAGLQKLREAATLHLKQGEEVLLDVLRKVVLRSLREHVQHEFHTAEGFVLHSDVKGSLPFHAILVHNREDEAFRIEIGVSIFHHGVDLFRVEAQQAFYVRAEMKYVLTVHISEAHQFGQESHYPCFFTRRSVVDEVGLRE